MHELVFGTNFASLRAVLVEIIVTNGKARKVLLNLQESQTSGNPSQKWVEQLKVVGFDGCAE